jgi:hypothetical protein
MSEVNTVGIAFHIVARLISVELHVKKLRKKHIALMCIASVLPL